MTRPVCYSPDMVSKKTPILIILRILLIVALIASILFTLVSPTLFFLPNNIIIRIILVVILAIILCFITCATLMHAGRREGIFAYVSEHATQEDLKQFEQIVRSWNEVFTITYCTGEEMATLFGTDEVVPSGFVIGPKGVDNTLLIVKNIQENPIFAKIAFGGDVLGSVTYASDPH